MFSFRALPHDLSRELPEIGLALPNCLASPKAQLSNRRGEANVAVGQKIAHGTRPPTCDRSTFSSCHDCRFANKRHDLGLGFVQSCR